MSESSDRVPEMARNIESHLLRALAERSQARVAEALGVDESTMSRWVAAESGLRRACEVIAALGLRLRPAHQPDFSETYVAALETLAREQLDRRKNSRGGA